MSSVHGDSVFLIRTLEKILSDKETKRSQHQQLKKACEEALSKLFILMTTPTTHNKEMTTFLGVINILIHTCTCICMIMSSKILCESQRFMKGNGKGRRCG